MKQETTFLNYREIVPAPLVAHLVFYFCEFSVSEKLKKPLLHEIFPDGCVSLIYRRNKNLNTNLLLLFGLAIEPTVKEIFPGDVLWIVKFAPSASRMILQTDPAEIETRPLFDETFLPHLTKGLLKRLELCNDFESAVLIFQERLLSLKINRSDTDRITADAVKIIAETKGEIKIAELSKKLGLSVRQLQRRFQNASGLTPKQFVRTQRFHAAARRLVKENSPKLVDFAAEMGFADQSHLTHEFASITGRSPKSFAEKIKEIEYGDLLE
jgi:AraC-like DNA-binding protein